MCSKNTALNSSFYEFYNITATSFFFLEFLNVKLF